MVGIPLGLLTFRAMFEVIDSDLFGAAPEWHRQPPVWQMALMLPACQAARLHVARVLRWD